MASLISGCFCSADFPNLKTEAATGRSNFPFLLAPDRGRPEAKRTEKFLKGETEENQVSPSTFKGVPNGSYKGCQFTIP